MTRTIALDCEFVPPILTPEGLISIGMTDGTNTFYGINAEVDFDAVRSWKHPWMLDNVIRHLPLDLDGDLETSHPDVYTYDQLEIKVRQFFEIGGDRHDQILYMNCGAQDMIRLHTLWDNDWSAMPGCIPHSFEDMAHVFRRLELTSSEIPKIDPDRAHHALYDAEHEHMLLRMYGLAG